MTTRNPFDEIHAKPKYQPLASFKEARDIAKQMKREGFSLEVIAEALGFQGYLNQHGRVYHKSTIHFLLKGRKT